MISLENVWNMQFLDFGILWSIIPAFLLLYLIVRAVGLNKKRGLFLLWRSLTVLVVLLAIASPFVITEKDITKKSMSVTLIDDFTDSMQLYPDGSVQTLKEELEKDIGSTISSVNVMNISGESRLGDSVYDAIVSSGVEKNVIVLRSDGQSTYGKDLLTVSEFAPSVKSNILTVIPELAKKDVYIKDIEVTEKLTAGSNVDGKVKVGLVGDSSSYEIVVKINEETVLDTSKTQLAEEDEVAFSKTLEKEGIYRITATITPSTKDEFSENNIYFKTVNVVEKPEILLVTEAEDSPLAQVLKETYDVSTAESITGKPRQRAVVIDNIPKSGIKNYEALKDYLSEGNGMLVVGGRNAYDNGEYYESSFETLLPVKSVADSAGKKDQLVVIMLIDISGTSGWKFVQESKLDVEKAIAINVLRALPEDALVGVLAFNTEAFVVSSIKKQTDKQLLEDKISRLQAGGGTDIYAAQKKAEELLGIVQGNKNIVLLSDGGTVLPTVQKSYILAATQAEQGTKTYAVGVGRVIWEDFLIKIAEMGNGDFFRPEETERLKIIFGSEEKEDKDPGLITLNKNHFITKTVDLSGLSTSGHNRVTAKASAQVLVSTHSNDPAITVWRFGLGRIVALTLDNGNVWAPKLYGQYSKLVSTMVNWVLSSRKSGEVRLECEDALVGEEAVIRVVSDKEQNSVSGESGSLKLSQLDETNYYTTFKANAAGFKSFSLGGQTCMMALNYPKEYYTLGVDEQGLEVISTVSGGNSYTDEDMSKLKNDIIELAGQESKGRVIGQQNLQIYFSLLALGMFFLDVVLRRVSEVLGRFKKSSME